jgi:hypothetical protein
MLVYYGRRGRGRGENINKTRFANNTKQTNNDMLHKHLILFILNKNMAKVRGVSGYIK